jgi:hypothetical protein
VRRICTATLGTEDLELGQYSSTSFSPIKLVSINWDGTEGINNRARVKYYTADGEAISQYGSYFTGDYYAVLRALSGVGIEEGPILPLTENANIKAPRASDKYKEKVDFTPNLDRKHTRGRRGNFVVQRDEGDYAKPDRHAAKRRLMTKVTTSRQHADEKRFRLRGQAGGDHTVSRSSGKKGIKQEVRGEQRFTAMTREARRQRLESHTEGASKMVKNRINFFKLNVGLPPKHMRGKKKPVKRLHVPVDKPIQLVSVYRRYNRTGELPKMTIEQFDNGDKTGVSAKQLRKMRNQLLLRAGTEQNPGPSVKVVLPPCEFDGIECVGEVEEGAGWWHLKCPLCSSTLGRYGRGSQFRLDGRNFKGTHPIRGLYPRQFKPVMGGDLVPENAPALVPIKGAVIFGVSGIGKSTLSRMLPHSFDLEVIQCVVDEQIRSNPNSRPAFGPVNYWQKGVTAQNMDLLYNKAIITEAGRRPPALVFFAAGMSVDACPPGYVPAVLTAPKSVIMQRRRSRNPTHPQKKREREIDYFEKLNMIHIDASGSLEETLERLFLFLSKEVPVYHVADQASLDHVAPAPLVESLSQCDDSSALTTSDDDVFTSIDLDSNSECITPDLTPTLPPRVPDHVETHSEHGGDEELGGEVVLDGIRLQSRLIRNVARRYASETSLLSWLYPPLSLHSFRVSTKTIPYQEERRLIPNRNVLETKQPFVCQQIEFKTTRTNSFFWLHLLLFLVNLVYTSVMAYKHGVSNALLVKFFVTLFIGMASGLSLSLILRESRILYIPYVPHLISSIVAEYDRGCNAESVRNTIRQKMRRLASFPLPDRDALQIMVGTELMAMELIRESDYFWEGAACMQVLMSP